MPPPTAVAAVLDAWDDLDRALAGLSAPDAGRSLGGASPISWTVAHLAESQDRLINDLFAGLERNAFLMENRRFTFSAAGEPADWETVLREAGRVREASRAFLDGLTDADLERRVPYEGSSVNLQETARRSGGVPLRNAFIRVALHTYYHIGEIVTARRAAGHEVGDFPGLLEASM